MGGVLVDLRDAVFEAPETVITVTAVMGGVQVLVPEDVRVVEHGLGLMGGFTSACAKSVTQGSRDLPADAPVVRVRGVAVMGGVEVRRVPRRRREIPGS
jgi:predicted membrane protein